MGCVVGTRHCPCLCSCGYAISQGICVVAGGHHLCVIVGLPSWVVVACGWVVVVMIIRWWWWAVAVSCTCCFMVVVGLIAIHICGQPVFVAVHDRCGPSLFIVIAVGSGSCVYCWWW